MANAGFVHKIEGGGDIMNKTRLKIEGNAFYEIDLNCLKRKEEHGCQKDAASKRREYKECIKKTRQ